MFNTFKKIINKRITPNDGAATYIFMFSLIPLIAFVLLIAIDLNMYLLARSQLQNALDAASTSAVNRSTNDIDRSNKDLKLILTETNNKNFINRLKEGIQQNFKPRDGYIETTHGAAYVSSDPVIYATHKLIFLPSYSFIKDPVELNAEYKVAPTHGTDLLGGGTNYDIELAMSGTVMLPTTQKLYEFMGGMEVFKVPVTVKTAVRGIRVKKSDDFNAKPWE